MSVLGERDLIKELGKGILFHPLKPGSIKGCNLCLTASRFAYAIGKKEKLAIQKKVDVNDPHREIEYFEIPPQDTTLVWTHESVWLDGYFFSPIYATVSLVSKGIGHIGTRLNPCWSGALCIALHNLSKESVHIHIQDTNEPIAYLILERLSSKSVMKSNVDVAARLDVLRGLPNTNEIYDFFNDRNNLWMQGNTDALRKLCVNSSEYKKLKAGFRQMLLLPLGTDTITRWTAIAAIAALLTAFITAIQVFKPASNSSPDSTPTPKKKSQ